jgi:hypothetical protein
MRILLLLQHWLHSFSMPAPRRATATTATAPEAEYVRRLTLCDQQLLQVRAWHRRLWVYLTAALLAMLAVGWMTLLSVASAVWLTPFVTVVACCFRALTRTARSYRRLEALAKYYEGGLARLQNCWQGKGSGSEEYRPADHLYAADLDIFGPGSLFEFLCTARTGIGRESLAKWLLDQATSDEVAQRQKAIAELSDKVELREDWASLGSTFADHVSPTVLKEWAEAAPRRFSPILRVLAIVLPVSLVVLLVLMRVGMITSYWALALPVAGETLVAITLLKPVGALAANVDLPAFELGAIAPLLGRLNREKFESPLLKSLQTSGGTLSESSRALLKLRALAWLLQLRNSEYLALALAPLLWGTNLAMAVEGWRARHGEHVREWLNSIGQFEALVCLAGFAYEHPEHVFPSVVQSDAPYLQAERIGHPLLPESSCVRCDVQLHETDCRLLMVSGSNMSGKSTLLRTVGVNVALAMAGAPVCAARFRLSPLRIGCSIGVGDSLRDGRSRFQAEVERLKDVIALARCARALVLLDEVLSGTNSQDRLFGAAAVLEQLRQCGALAMVTTHDLALTTIADVAGARNVHFEESYEGGEMKFDYILRDGTLARTNGAHVIAALGLVPESLPRVKLPP